MNGSEQWYNVKYDDKDQVLYIITNLLLDIDKGDFEFC